jgi:hypothetical protein
VKATRPSGPKEVVAEASTGEPTAVVWRSGLALALPGADAADVAVAWRPFQLNPDLPRGGTDRRAYRTAKFGGWERSLELEARVAEAGAAEGLAFDFARIARTPNTFDAHRLVWLAGRHGVQPAVEGLFGAYFAEGRDVGDPGVLAEVGATAGLDRPAVERMLGGVPPQSVRGDDDLRKRIDYRFIRVHSLVPVYAEELELVRRAGIEELVRRLEARGLPTWVDPRRPNVA